ncbi:hypothetical protein WHR41_01747 [Cladosporium halotolerans]|uniref:RCC1-like domain-containing protein n=1 Tax=Cladosporium halotolerans TaxID=1052096 RepID=A0AB34KX81_9PEZI
MLFALGSNGSGQLGLGHDEDVAVPQAVLASKEIFSSGIKRLLAGGNHTVVLSCDGRAWASGDNSDGRCGTKDGEAEAQFKEIFQPDGRAGKWDDVAATWSATMLTRNNGAETWVCGSGDSGELGLGQGVREAKLMARVPAFPPAGTRIVQLSACMAHVVAVLDDGEVWGWGKGRKGQLGETLEDAWKPRRIENVGFRVERAVCGKDFTCLVGSRDVGEVAMLGPNGRDRFEVKAQAPSKVPDRKEVNASWGSVYMLQESGRVVAWGRDDHGQLPPQDLPLMENIAAGSEHCISLTQDGRVLAWGWGEHGNCGENIDAKGDVKGNFNEIRVSGKVAGLFAGCATSFIATSGG